MIFDIGYWNKVIKRILLITFSVVLLYALFKLSIFYMPFLIAFIVSLCIEPIIKKMMKKIKLSRKLSSIIILCLIFIIIAGSIIWMITSLISESYNLLQSLNIYFEKIYVQIQNISQKIDLNKLPNEVKVFINNSITDFMRFLSDFIRTFLNSVLKNITSLPTISIYIVITILATYFICSDKIYMLDQLEHHLPQIWVKKFSKHLREIVKILGNYLKSQIILIVIAFFQVLIGLYILKFLKFNIEYPFLFALGIGFVDALPILGTGTVMVPWAIVSSLDGNIGLAIGLLVIYIIVLIVRQLIEPKIVSSQIGIHPIFTLIAMYTGFKLIGVWGLILGPIILIILKNIFGNLIDGGIIKTILGRN